MDPLYSSSVLASASRQVTDPSWPAAPIDKEMISWSPPQDRPRLHLALAVLLSFRALVNRLGDRLRRPAASTAG